MWLQGYNRGYEHTMHSTPCCGLTRESRLVGSADWSHQSHRKQFARYVVNVHNTEIKLLLDCRRQKISWLYRFRYWIFTLLTTYLARYDMFQLAGCAQACQHGVGSHREQPPSDNTSLGSCNPSAALLFLCWHSIWGWCWQEMPGEFLHCLSATFSSHTPQISKWNFRLLRRIFSVLDWTAGKLGFVAEDTVRYYPFTLCPSELSAAYRGSCLGCNKVWASNHHL